VAAFKQQSDGDFDLTLGRLSLVTGSEEKAQKISNRLSIFKDEWFLDTRAGVPWFDVVLGIKNPDLEIVKRLLRKVILSVPGIIDLPELEVEYDGAARTLTYTFRALDDEGVSITGGSGEPYIVDV
jgi:hypothetical protein